MINKTPNKKIKSSYNFVSGLIIIFLLFGVGHEFYHDHSNHKTANQSHCCDSHKEKTSTETNENNSEKSKSDCPVYTFLASLKTGSLIFGFELINFGLFFFGIITLSVSKIETSDYFSYLNRGPPAFSLNI